MDLDEQPVESARAARWRPISAIERRVLGVLIEKAKTTPENYPLSLNALRTGSNQKSNRAPFMQLEEDQVAEALESLRKAGAVAEIQGGARVDKYRHLAYDWLGVDKVELAVMAELLLRGAQTVGELRGRAARMEPIKELSQLQPILDSLLAKGLIVRLTPAGRGSVITHALYLDHEMEKVRREINTAGDMDGVAHTEEASSSDSPRNGPIAPRDVGQHDLRRPRSAGEPPELDSLQREVAALRSDVLALRADFDATAEQLRRELDELNRQLGN